MKAYSLIIALAGLLIVTGTVEAQPVKERNKFPFLRRYVTNVRLIGQTRQEIGVLFAVTDSTLVLAPIKGLKETLQTIVSEHGGTLPPLDSLPPTLALRTYKYSQVSRLLLRRRGHALKGLLIGIGVGMVLGFADGDDPPGWFSFSAGDKAVLFGILSTPFGLLASLVSIKNADAKRKPIATEMQGRLRKYAIVEQLKKADVYTP
jgi:hypothetical protein